MSFKNKIIVVTGGSGRLGLPIVSAFVNEGAQVITVDQRERDCDGNTISMAANLTDEEAVTATMAGIADRFGKIDVLIHTVGMWDGRPITETSLADWRLMMDVNLTSAFLCLREGVRYMKDTGRLIGISSGQGADHGPAQQAAYAASKAGVMRLVECIADEYKNTGITAHSIAPSMILFDENEDAAGVSVNQIVDWCLHLCGRAGDAASGSLIRVYGNA